MNNPLTITDLMSPLEKASFNKRVARIGGPSYVGTTNWFERSWEQVKTYNSLALLAQAGPINNAYEQAGYNPATDPVVKANSWIQQYYPDAWMDILQSRSSVYSSSMISNIRKNHESKTKIGEGGFIGNFVGGVLAGFVDPINYLIPGAAYAKRGIGAFAASRGAARETAEQALQNIAAQRAAELAGMTFKEKAFRSAAENIAAQMLIEPLLQDADATREMEDVLFDLAGGAVAGVGITAFFEGAGRATSATRRAANRHVYGFDSQEEFLDNYQGRIYELTHATEEQKNFWLKIEELESWTDLTRDDRDYFNDTVEGAIIEIAPKLGEVKGIDKLVKWIAVNPVNKLITKKGATAGITRRLVETQIEGVDESTDVPIESKLKLFNFMFGRQISDFSAPFDKFVELNSIDEFDGAELRSMITAIIRSGADTVEGTQIEYRGLDEENNRKSYDPLELVRGDDKQHVRDFLNEMVPKYRDIITRIDKTLDEIGFLSSDLSQVDLFGINLATYVPRRVDFAKVDSAGYIEGTYQNGFLDGIREGIVAERGNLVSKFRQNIENLREKLETLERDRDRSEEGGAHRQRLERRIESALEEIQHLEEGIFGLENQDEVFLNSLAESIFKNYTRKHSDHFATRNTGRGSMSSTETLARKVNIEDRYIADYLINDPAVLFDQMRQMTLPKALVADEMMRLAPAKMHMNAKIYALIKRARALYQEMEDAYEGSRGRHPDDVNPNDFIEAQVKFEEIKEQIKDYVQASNTLHSLMMITKNPDDPNYLRAEIFNDETGEFEPVKFDSHTDAVNYLIDTVEKRAENRKKMNRLLVEMRKIEEDLIEAAEDTDFQGLIGQRTSLEEELNILESQEMPEQPYYDVLNEEEFIPLDRGLNPDDQVFFDPDSDDLVIDYVFTRGNQRGNKLRFTVVYEGKRSGAGKVVDVDSAGKVADDDTITFDNQPGKVITFKIDGETKWAWVSPEDLRDLQNEALKEARLDVADAVRVNAARRAEQEIEQPRGLPQSLRDHVEQQREAEITSLREQIAEIDEQLRDLYSADDADGSRLGDLDSRRSNVLNDYESERASFKRKTKRLNYFAKEIRRLTAGDRDLESIGASKPTFEELSQQSINGQSGNTQTPSIYEYIGFDENHDFEGVYGREPHRMMGLYDGAPQTQRESGFRDFPGELQMIIEIGQNMRKSNLDFYERPDWLIAEIIRDNHTKPPEERLSAREIADVKNQIGFLIDQMQMKNLGGDGNVDMETAFRIIKNMNYMRYMGMVTISSLGDFANAVGTLGLTRYVGTMWQYLSNLKERKNLSLLGSLQAAGEIAMMENSRVSQLFGIDSGSNYFDPVTEAPIRSGRGPKDSRLSSALDFVDSKTNQNSWFMGKYNKYGNFLNHWNAFNKRMVTLGIEDMLIDVSIKVAAGRSVSERDLGVLRSLGFGERDFSYIAAQYGEHGSTKKKVFGGDFYLSGSGNWTGNDFFRYQMKVNAAVDSIIVTPGLGDLPKWFKDSRLAPLVQFKSFLFASTQRLFLPMVQRGVVYKDLNQFAMLFGQTMLGTLSYAIHEIANGKDPFDSSLREDEETGEMVPNNWKAKMVLEGIERGGSLSLLFGMSNFTDRTLGFGIHTLFGGELGQRYRARTLSDIAFGPLGGFGDDLFKSLGLVSAPFKGEFSEGQLGALRRMIPFQNVIWMKALVDGIPSVLETMANRDPSRSFREQYSGNYRDAEGRFFDYLGAE